MSAQWTWLIYMAGDNNLEGAGKVNLGQMQQAGSTDDVNIVVQFATEENKTIRYRVEKDKLNVLQEMEGTDTGDPEVLTDFIKWGNDNYPAQHYMLDVWNHGGGWENLPPDYDYDSLRSAKPKMASKLNKVKRSLFRTTFQEIHARTPIERAIAIDCGAHDYLDNQKLRSAVFNALPNGNKIDIIGCDACLMNMLEISYELKDTANFMVGSEETEPGQGWPYGPILQNLINNPEMAPAELAKTIANDYGDWYKDNGDPVKDGAATQSALDMSQLQAIAGAVNGLADVLINGLNNDTAGAISLAKEKAQKFEMPEYLDLGDYAKQLLKTMGQNPDVKKAAEDILSALQPETGSGFVIANATWGSKVQKATGVSIYFPAQPGNYSADYADLEFSKDGEWNKFLKKWHDFELE